MGLFSGLMRGGDKKKKAAKYHNEQPGVAEKDILNQAFLGDDPYLRAGNGPAKLFPGNDGFRPHDYRPGSPGSDADSIDNVPAHTSGYGSKYGSNYGSNYSSRQQSPAILQPPQFSQFSNNSASNLPSRPWSSGTSNGPPDGRPSTSHGSGTKQWGSNTPTFESRFGPVHQRADTECTVWPANQPGSRAGSRAGTQSPQSPRSPTHSGRSRDPISQTSNMAKNLSTSSVSPTEDSGTSQHTSATATSASDGQPATSPPSTVSNHSNSSPTPSSDKVGPLADGNTLADKNASPSTPSSPTTPKETRARDVAKKMDLAIQVPRRRSWSAQINQLEKAWLEEQLKQQQQNTQEKEALPTGSQLEVAEEKAEKEATATVDSQTTPMSPGHVNAPPGDNQVKAQQRPPPQELSQNQKQGVPRQSPQTPQGPIPSLRGHMASQSAHLPVRRGPPQLPHGRAFDPSFDPSFDPRFDPRNDPRFDPRNMSRNDPRFDTRFDPRSDPRAGSRQGPRPWPQHAPQQMPHPPPNAPRERGRAVDYDFMPSSLDQYGGVGGGPYAMGRTARVAPPGVQPSEMPMVGPRSASSGMPRPHHRMPSDIDIDISTPIDVGGRMPETRLPAVLRGSQSMQQLPKMPRENRGPMPMSPPLAQNPYHARTGSMASQASQGSYYNRGHPHRPPPPPGMRSASAQGMRSPQYPMPLPAVGMREGGSRYPTSGPGPAGPRMGPGPGPGPRRLAHSSSADLTVYRDRHHQYGPMRSPMNGPGYGPGPRPGPDQGFYPHQQPQQHPQPQFAPPVDRRNIDPRADTRSDPRYLNMPSPASPSGAYDRQLSDVAEDIEEKSVIDMPGVAVQDFASKKEETSEPIESMAEDREVSLSSFPQPAARAIASDVPPSYSPPDTSAAVAAVEPTEPGEPVLQVPAPSEPGAEAPAVVASTTESENKAGVTVEIAGTAEETVEETVEEPATPKAAIAELTPTAEKSVPKLLFVEPTREISPAHSPSRQPSDATENTDVTDPLSPGFGSYPLTPVTPTADKLPSHAVSNSIAFPQAIDAPARSTPERSPERSQVIAERRRTRYPTRADNTPPDTPIVDVMPPSPVSVASVDEVREDDDEVKGSEENDEETDLSTADLSTADLSTADLSTDATTSVEDASRPQTPVALSKDVAAEIETETEAIAQPMEEVEDVRQVDVKAVELENASIDIVEAAAEPVSTEVAGDDIIETVVAVQPRSGSGATDYSSPPMSPMSLPAGDAEPSANANWPLPSMFVSPASRSASPSPSRQSIPIIVTSDDVGEKDVDTKSVDDTSSEDEKDIDDSFLVGSLPSPVRKTAFTASIYAKDIGIGPYAFDDTTPGSLSSMDKPAGPVAAAQKADENAASHMARPATPTRDLAPADMMLASPESTYSWGGDEVIAVTPTRQSDEIAENDENAEAPEIAKAADVVKPGEKKETGLMDVPPESIGLARGPSILADMETLSSRGSRRRWNIGLHANKETLQERLTEVASPAVRTEDSASASASAVPASPVLPSRVSPMLPTSPVSPTAASPTRKAKKGPPPPLTSVPQFNRHMPTDVVDKFGTTFI